MHFGYSICIAIFTCILVYNFFSLCFEQCLLTCAQIREITGKQVKEMFHRVIRKWQTVLNVDESMHRENWGAGRGESEAWSSSTWEPETPHFSLKL